MAALLVLLLALVPGRARGQETIAGLAAECGGGDAAATARCREIALAGQAARAGLGLLAGGGSELPGSAATLGWRLGSVPRIAVGGRIGAGRIPAPRLPAGPTTVPLDEDHFSAVTLGGSAGVGLFDGFSPVPTVGGVLSLDLLGTGRVVFLPEDHGFDGSSSTYGVGLRLGLLRESFTLPGVSVSAMQRWSGEVVTDGADPTSRPSGPQASFEPSTTSLRATVGKDLLAVGLLAGVGWDRYTGPLRIVPAAGGGGAGAPVPAATDDLVDSRFLAFGSASLNFLILHVSAEAGWAEGLEAVPGRSGGGFDPTAASWFGSLGARLTY